MVVLSSRDLSAIQKLGPAFQNQVFLEAPGGVVSTPQNQWLRMNAEGRFLECLGDFECSTSRKRKETDVFSGR
jgi:hypothetical protein